MGLKKSEIMQLHTLALASLLLWATSNTATPRFIEAPTSNVQFKEFRESAPTETSSQQHKDYWNIRNEIIKVLASNPEKEMLKFKSKKNAAKRANPEVAYNFLTQTLFQGQYIRANIVPLLYNCLDVLQSNREVKGALQGLNRTILPDSKINKMKRSLDSLTDLKEARIYTFIREYYFEIQQIIKTFIKFNDGFLEKHIGLNREQLKTFNSRGEGYAIHKDATVFTKRDLLDYQTLDGTTAWDIGVADSHWVRKTLNFFVFLNAKAVYRAIKDLCHLKAPTMRLRDPLKGVAPRR